MVRIAVIGALLAFAGPAMGQVGFAEGWNGGGASDPWRTQGGAAFNCGQGNVAACRDWDAMSQRGGAVLPPPWAYGQDDWRRTAPQAPSPYPRPPLERGPYNWNPPRY